jgi:hypothetical protein
MKQVFSRMLDDPQEPPLRGSAEVLAAARRSARRGLGLRTVAATLAVGAMVGSWTLLRDGSKPMPRLDAAPSATVGPVQLTAADVPDRLEPRPTPSPVRRIMSIIESRTKSGYIFWYVDTLAPVADPCELPYDLPYAPGDSCNVLRTEQGDVWVRRQHPGPFAVGGNVESSNVPASVVSIYVPVSEDRVLLYTASNIELPGSDGSWGRWGVGFLFEITNAEIAHIAELARGLGQG